MPEDCLQNKKGRGKESIKIGPDRYKNKKLKEPNAGTPTGNAWRS